MNDGIGKISHSLLKEVRDIMGLDTLPVAIQGRIGSAKGIWMLDLSSVSSDDQWIETYPSQRKWHCNWSDPAHRILEVVSYSRELQQATLNHQFIPILEEQAINRGLLQTTLCNRIDQQLSQELDEAKAALESPELFRKWTHRYNHSQSGANQHDSSWFIGGLPQDRRETMSFLVDGGFDPKRLKYLNTKMFELQNDRWQRTKEKLHIKITKSTYALMTVDFQGILAPNEVQLCFSPAFNDGNQTLHDLGGVEVLVSRCPAHLPSDIQKVKAVFRPELRQLKNVVIFSSLGESPLAAKLSGGDYDGDKAWICWDPDVVKNFEGAQVEPAISFEKYFQPNTQTTGHLIYRYGKPKYVDKLMEEAFNFHLSPTYMGLCTTYKERLSYHMGGIGNPTILFLSMLLSELVDQEKSGFEFDDNVWLRIRNDKCGGIRYPESPAYRSHHSGCLPSPTRLIDVLKHCIQDRIHECLKNLWQSRTGPGIDPQLPVLTDFDSDLVKPWENFEKEAKRLTSLFDPSSP